MCVCVCVSMCLCMCVCVSVCVRALSHMNVYVCMRALFVCMYVCICVSTYLFHFFYRYDKFFLKGPHISFYTKISLMHHLNLSQSHALTITLPHTYIHTHVRT